MTDVSAEEYVNRQWNLDLGKLEPGGPMKNFADAMAAAVRHCRLPCVSTAFVARALPLSTQTTAFVAQTLPFLAVLRARRWQVSPLRPPGSRSRAPLQFAAYARTSAVRGDKPVPSAAPSLRTLPAPLLHHHLWADHLGRTNHALQQCSVCVCVCVWVGGLRHSVSACRSRLCARRRTTC